MQKFRSLIGIDTGDGGLANKHAYAFKGQTIAPWVITPDFANNYAVEFHSAYRTKATKTIGGTFYAGSGFERFESTEFHKPKFNNCNHIIVSKTVNYPFTPCYYLSGRMYTQAYCRVNPGNLVSIAVEPLDWASVSSNLRAEAYHTMIPRFEGELSLLNFLYEMKDFRDIAKTFSRTSDKFLAALGVEGNLTRAAKRIATAHLVKSFAIDPLISDGIEMIKQMQSIAWIEEQKFQQAGLLPASRHFAKTMNQLQTPMVRTNRFSNTAACYACTGSKYVTKFTATMEGTYGYTARSGLDGFAQYWGLHPTAEAVWNALPFSFLADYVLSIGHALKVMRKDKNVSYKPAQYCESLLNLSQSGIFLERGSSTTTGMFWLSLNGKPTQNPEQFPFVAGSLNSAYQRIVRTPYWGPFLPRLKIPTGKQALNCAALATVFL